MKKKHNINLNTMRKTYPTIFYKFTALRYIIRVQPVDVYKSLTRGSAHDLSAANNKARGRGRGKT